MRAVGSDAERHNLGWTSMWEFLLKHASRYWHRPWAGMVSAVAIGMATFALVSGGGAHSPTPPGWVIVGLFAVSPLVAWWLSHRIPAVPRGKVGIVVSLVCDDEEHDRRVRADFIDQLRKQLERDPGGANFSLVVFPQHLAARIEGYPGAGSLLRRARGHLILFGRVRKRELQGQSVHVLTFDGVIRHAPIPQQVSKVLSTEFGTAIPRQVIFPTDADFLTFEATSGWTDVSARYVIGVAALVTGSVAYAERLLLEVERSIAHGRLLPPARQIARGVQQYLSVLYDRWLVHLIDRYTMTRDVDFLRTCEPIVDKLLARDPHSYRALLQKAMCEFTLRRNVAEAMRFANSAHRSDDETWRYNVAFLYAYQGNLDRAEYAYESAFSGRLNDVTVPVQCEEFIHLVLDEEPDKVQLYYCSGLINFFAKKDYAGAIRDLEMFVSRCEPGRLQPQTRRAEELIREAKKQA